MSATATVSAPSALVFDGADAITAGTGTVDYGTVVVGKAATRTFTLRNAGTAPLSLSGPIIVPTGFTLVSGFGTSTLAPGASTTFAVLSMPRP